MTTDGAGNWMAVWYSQDDLGGTIGTDRDILVARNVMADCNSNGIPDECDVAVGTSADCQSNGIPDECDITSGTSEDCNANSVPDECEWDDLDSDGDVDLGDFARFQTCFTGSGGTFVDPACCLFDLEPDGDIDLDDYAEFRSRFTGPQP